MTTKEKSALEMFGARLPRQLVARLRVHLIKVNAAQDSDLPKILIKDEVPKALTRYLDSEEKRAERKKKRRKK